MTRAGGSGRSEAQRFVGRAGELSALGAELERVRAGQPRVVLVEGAAGMGKTALLARFCAEVDGSTVLTSSGYEDESLYPYGVFEQLLGGSPDGAELLARLRSHRGEDPLAIGAGFLGVLNALDGHRPVVLVVDDVHWADVPSVTALCFALRRLRFDHVLAVLAARPDAPELPQGVTRLADTDLVTRLRLDGLDVADLVELSTSVGTGRLPRAAALRLEAATGGNPLYAREMLVQFDHQLLADAGGPLPAPRSFTAGVVARVAACSEGTRRLVEAAAVLGQRCALAAATRLGGVDDVAGALEEAVSARLLEAATPIIEREIAFPHPLVRNAVYHDLFPGRRTELHAGAAVLVDEPAALEHRIAAVLVDDAVLAAEVAAYARREATDGSAASAASHLQAAARLCADRAAREGLTLEAVEQLILAGEIGRAVALAEEVAGFTHTAMRDYILGYLAIESGRSPGAEGLLTAAWQASQAESNEGLAALVSALLTIVCAMQGRNAEAVEWARRGLAGHPEPRLAGTAMHWQVMTLGAAGRAQEALDVVADLPNGSEALSPRDVGGLLGRGNVRLWTDDLAGAHADHSAVMAATRHQLTALPFLSAMAFQADVSYRQGAWDESVAHAALVVSLVRDADRTWLRSLAHPMSVWVLAARGEFEQAAAHVQAASEAATAIGEAVGVGFAATAAAHLEFCRGNPDGVVTALQPIRSLPADRSVGDHGVLRWRELGAGALVTLGRLDEAEQLLAPLETDAAEAHRRSSLVGAARVRGALHAARGNPDRARAAFDAGLAHAENLPMPFERALLDDAYGRFLRRCGQRRDAVVHLHAALNRYTTLGARPFTERCERELAACGLTPRPRSAPARTALTPQELSVARLVATGAANRDVAAELVVSVKTVEYHLGNVYTKLGVKSRLQLATTFAAATT